MSNARIPIINLLGLCLLLFSESVVAQHLPLINLYSDNINTINPSLFSSNYARDGYDLSINALHRSQWLGLEGAPATQLVSAEVILENSPLVLGGHLINDKAGPIGHSGAYLKIGTYISGRHLEDGAITAAITAGVNQFRINGSEIRFRDIEPLVPDQSVFYPDIGLGIGFFRKVDFGIFEGDIISGGLSIPQVFSLKYNVSSDQNDQYELSRSRQFFGNLGITKFYDNDTFLELTSWIKYIEGSKIHTDLNIKYKMNRSFWFGMGASTNLAYSLQIGFEFYDALSSDSVLKLIYNYGDSMQNKSIYLRNSHELTLAYAINRGGSSYGF